MMKKNSPQPRSILICHSDVGKPAAIEVKISSDMPLPTPRSVMSSPSHMMTLVPAVMVMTMTRMPQMPMSRVDDVAVQPLEQLAGLAGQRDQAGRLQDGQADGEIARVLRQPRRAGLALLLEGLEPGDDHGQQLHDDAGRDVGHDAQREDRQLQQRTAAEQVDQAVEAGAALLSRCSP